MLDDLKYIHAHDSADKLGAAEQQIDQLSAAFEIPPIDGTVSDVVFAGMGGSGLWGRLSTSWPGYRVPFTLWQRYGAPTHVSKTTLFIAASYPGNTEETLDALQAAENAGSHIVVIAGGGELIDIAKRKKYPHIVLPPAQHPRLTRFSGVAALLAVCIQAGLLKQSVLEELIEAQTFLKTEVAAWKPDVPERKNLAKQLALEIAGTTPIVYSGAALAPAAHAWKVSFNENAKNTAWIGELPEFSHNELSGWSSHPVDKPFRVVELRSSFEHPGVVKRFKLGQTFLSGMRPHPITVQAIGDTLVEQLLYSFVLGDFVGIYVGLLNGVDPSPLPLIDKLKTEL